MISKGKSGFFRGIQEKIMLIFHEFSRDVTEFYILSKGKGSFFYPDFSRVN